MNFSMKRAICLNSVAHKMELLGTAEAYRIGMSTGEVSLLHV